MLLSIPFIASGSALVASPSAGSAMYVSTVDMPRRMSSTASPKPNEMIRAWRRHCGSTSAPCGAPATR